MGNNPEGKTCLFIGGIADGEMRIVYTYYGGSWAVPVPCDMSVWDSGQDPSEVTIKVHRYILRNIAGTNLCIYDQIKTEAALIALLADGYWKSCFNERANDNLYGWRKK